MHGPTSEATQKTIWREELVEKEGLKKMVPSRLRSTIAVATIPSRMKSVPTIRKLG